MKVLHVLGAGEGSDQAVEVIGALQQAGVAQTVAAPLVLPRYRELERTRLRLYASPLTARWDFMQRVGLHWRIGRDRPDVVQFWGAAAMGLGAHPDFSGQIKAGWMPRGTDKKPPMPLVAPDRYGVNVFIPALRDYETPVPADRSQFATPRNAPIVLAYMPRPTSKAPNVLFSALRALPHSMAWLMGDNPLNREWEEQAYENGVLDRVRFLGRRENALALMRTADVCVLLSPREAAGSIAVQAWAMGTPVVACAEGALVQHEKTGMTFAANDTAGLSLAVRRLIKDEELKRAVVAQGYAAYVKDYSRQAVVAAWQAFYATLVRGGKS